MKIRVTVSGHDFEVEVGDLDSRPIVAMVDDERFEVWPEEARIEPAPLEAQAAAPKAGRAPVEARPEATSRRAGLRRAAAAPSPVPPTAAAPPGEAQRKVLAPLPGSIDSIAVQPGDVVRAGQPLVVIEAMKMKNTIRAPHDGEISAVQIAGGQHVKHGDVLVEYAE